MTGSVRPLRRDAAHNQQRLLCAAKEVLAERGMDATVEEIARVAGVGMGTLYRRYPTKESLVKALVRDMLAELREVARAALECEDGTGLETFLLRACELHVTHRGCLPRLWTHGVQDELDELRAMSGLLLSNAQRCATIRPDVSATDVTVIFWAVRGIIETTQDVAPDAWRRHLEIVIDGLRPAGRGLVTQPLSRAAVSEISSSRL